MGKKVKFCAECGSTLSKKEEESGWNFNTGRKEIDFCRIGCAVAWCVEQHIELMKK